MRNKMFVSGMLIIVALLAVAFIPKWMKHKEANSNNENEQGIQFIEANWSKALQEAKKQHKLIFIDAYASWCGPANT